MTQALSVQYQNREDPISWHPHLPEPIPSPLHFFEWRRVYEKGNTGGPDQPDCNLLTLILRRSRTGTVWFYISTTNKRAARPKLYTKSLTRDLKLMYSRLTLVRISINLQASCVLYIGTGVSLLFRERFLYI